MRVNREPVLRGTTQLGRNQQRLIPCLVQLDRDPVQRKAQRRAAGVHTDLTRRAVRVVENRGVHGREKPPLAPNRTDEENGLAIQNARPYADAEAARAGRDMQQRPGLDMVRVAPEPRPVYADRDGLRECIVFGQADFRGPFPPVVARRLLLSALTAAR